MSVRIQHMTRGRSVTHHCIVGHYLLCIRNGPKLYLGFLSLRSGQEINAAQLFGLQKQQESETFIHSWRAYISGQIALQPLQPLHVLFSEPFKRRKQHQDIICLDLKLHFCVKAPIFLSPFLLLDFKLVNHSTSNWRPHMPSCPV